MLSDTASETRGCVKQLLYADVGFLQAVFTLHLHALLRVPVLSKAIVIICAGKHQFVSALRDNAKAIVDVENTTGQVKQAQSVVPPMERLVQGLEKQQADTLK